MDLMQALALIYEAADYADNRDSAHDSLPEALGHLQSLGIERETLVHFWKAIHGDNRDVRVVTANATRDRIKLLVDERRRELKELRPRSYANLP